MAAPPPRILDWQPRTESGLKAKRAANVAAAAKLDPFEVTSRDADIAAKGQPVTITVKRQHGVMPLEVDMFSVQTVAQLKERIAEMAGVPVENQRIFARSCKLDDDRSLEACRLVRTPEVQLVPALRHKAVPTCQPISARRGFHMVQGNAPWKPDPRSILSADDVSHFWGSGEHDLKPAPAFRSTAPNKTSLQLAQSTHDEVGHFQAAAKLALHSLS